MPHDPLRTALEVREQLASSRRRLSFFLGAGTSMSVGLPGITELTKEVIKQLKPERKKVVEQVLAELPAGSHVEHVLDRVRIYRELMGSCTTKKDCAGLNDAKDARMLDSEICMAIREIVQRIPREGLGPHEAFAKWLRSLQAIRDWPVEIFTTNYDLLIETSFEAVGVPYFDGFVGAVSPFFVPESVDAELTKSDEFIYPPRSWTRLWKLHGSVNWCSRESNPPHARIVRTWERPAEGAELVVFPSREKYVQSRRLPYVTFQDRLRRNLASGESLLVVAGYSFSDEHLNDLLLQGLRSNPRLAILALVFGVEKQGKKSTPDGIVAMGTQHPNLTILGPEQASIAGIASTWGAPGRGRRTDETWPFWDEGKSEFTLGDYASFADFLRLSFAVEEPDVEPASPQDGKAQ
jgi:hypothetical protein